MPWAASSGVGAARYAWCRTVRWRRCGRSWTAVARCIVQDDLQLTEALGRALELPQREPSPERIAALQRQVRRQRLRRPLRRAAVAAAVALIALAGATLAVGTSHQKETSSADAVAISNTLRDIQEVQQAIKDGNRVQI